MPVPVGDQEIHEGLWPSERAVQSYFVGGMHACENVLVIGAYPNVEYLRVAGPPFDDRDSGVARFR
jgi:hypothetical protein